MASTPHTAKTAAGVNAGGTVVTPVACDAVNGDSFYQDGHSLLRLVNTDTASHTVTIPYVKTVDGVALTPKVITLAAAEVRYVAAGVPDKGYYGHPAKITFTANSALVKFELVNY